MTEDIPESVIAAIRAAAEKGFSTGSFRSADYRDQCWHFHMRTGTSVIFTRDFGGHFSDIRKQRFRHLSLSFFEPPRPSQPIPDPLVSVPFDESQARVWVKAIFGDDARLVWEEGPVTDEGKAVGVRHYRVFCDAEWNALEFHDRKLLVERGWKRWDPCG